MICFCRCSQSSHLNILTTFLPDYGDGQKVWMRSDFSLSWKDKYITSKAFRALSVTEESNLECRQNNGPVIPSRVCYIIIRNLEQNACFHTYPSLRFRSSILSSSSSPAPTSNSCVWERVRHTATCMALATITPDSLMSTRSQRCLYAIP